MNAENHHRLFISYFDCGKRYSFSSTVNYFMFYNQNTRRFIVSWGSENFTILFN